MKRVLRIALVVLGIAGLLALGRSGVFEAGIARIEALGAWAPVVFVVAQVVTTLAMVPSIVPTFAAGALFGFAQGLPLSLVGSGLGAVAALEVGRRFARERIARRFGSDPRFRAIDRLARERGWRFVVLARLSPVIPFTIGNYALGATPIRSRDYGFASVLGTLPSNAVYVYLGALAGDVATARVRDERSAAEWALLGLGVVATIVLTVALQRAMKPLLDDELARGESGDGDEPAPVETPGSDRDA